LTFAYTILVAVSPVTVEPSDTFCATNQKVRVLLYVVISLEIRNPEWSAAATRSMENEDHAGIWGVPALVISAWKPVEES
jgi:hypothetical protein